MPMGELDHLSHREWRQVNRDKNQQNLASDERWGRWEKVRVKIYFYCPSLAQWVDSHDCKQWHPCCLYKEDSIITGDQQPQPPC